MCNLKQTISKYWENIQGSLFPWLEEELDPLTKKQKQLISTLEIIRIEEHIPSSDWWMGRPPASRVAMARAFVAKSIYNISTTRLLLEHLYVDKNMRRICGWEKKSEIPSESTFSRAFAEFSNTRLPQEVHEALIQNIFQDTIVLHTSNDSTAVEAREKPQIKKKKIQQHKKGRPQKGEKRPPKEIDRLDKQPSMTLNEMLEELPKNCDVGCKKNSQGYIEKWRGYKFHLSTADGGIPLSAILTSASLHDSQVGIPLMKNNSHKVLYLYDLFDAAYDDQRIKNYSQALNHVPLIDINPRRNLQLKQELDQEAKARKILHWKMPQDVRYNERSTAERTNARLKDEFGGRNIRVRGHSKVFCHLMFGILALTVDQLISGFS